MRTTGPREEGEAGSKEIMAATGEVNSHLDSRPLLNHAIGYSPQGGASGGVLKVFVSNLAYETNWRSLKDHMRKAGGEVMRADIFEDDKGRSKGIG